MKRIKLSTIIIYFFLCILAVIYIGPLLWVVLVSFKTNAEIFQNPFSLPKILQWDNYKIAWSAGKLGSATLNSIFICVIALIISILVGSMAAFAIGKMRFKLANPLLTYFLIGMMIPVHSLLIPLFVSFSRMNLTDKLLALILPYVTFSLPMTIYILVNFFKGMPRDMFEAACIDGCSIYQCFFKIALPLAKTGMFVTGLMTFVANWNELLLAMVFISDVKKKTLPVTLTYFVGPYSTNYVQMFAAIVIAVVPSIVVYCCFSNQIVDGLTAGAVKG
ncbi:carbohydrate ABC transporter permease [Clostridium sp. Marseille-P299]|uniref:carbohydrate ABC transporter permease n=1 Tax=Clostridium sp. Marseille-P299 TaxID=1805477 RepID=UPI00082DB06A|nr:carbohydrate ABC transporter permease [Clostridium sp. Marseille-P299]